MINIVLLIVISVGGLWYGLVLAFAYCRFCQVEVSLPCASCISNVFKTEALSYNKSLNRQFWVGAVG